MTEKETVETKEKILEVAEKLFSKYGFEGASVREIAKHADANIASVNYYFKNKHGLYWAVMDRSHMLLEEGIRVASTRVETVEDLTVESFNFIMNEKKSFINAMKMMLGDEGIPQPDGGIEDLPCAKQLGPPGGKYFVEMIAGEVNEANPEQIEYAVKCIFSIMIQWGMFMVSAKKKLMQEVDPRFNEDHFRKLIRHHCRATLAYIKTNPNLS